MIGSLAQKTVDKVGTTECTSDQGWSRSGWTLYVASVADMAEDLLMPESTKRQLDEIAVCREIF